MNDISPKVLFSFVFVLCMVLLYYVKKDLNIVYDTEDINEEKGWKNTKLKNTQSQWKGLLKCQEVRLKRLHDKCERYGLIPNTSLHELSENDLKTFLTKFLTDDVHNFILKAIPKTGCTSWKTLVLNNTMHYLSWVKKMPYVHRYQRMQVETGVYSLQDFNKPAILLRLKKYFSVITVRHPFARLESAFRDKKAQVKQADVESQREDLQIKFLEFLDGPVMTKNDRHWKTYMNHAYPCIIPYNFIAKTETANPEMRYVVEEKLSKIGGPIQKNPSFSLKSDKKLNNSDRLLPFFSQLKNPEKQIQKLMTKYGKDMEMFGYTWEIREDGVYATCDSYEFDGMCC